MNTRTTTLRALRQYPSWQDGGETGDDPSLTDDLVVTVREDGSIAVADGSGGVLVYGDDDAEWTNWLASQGLLPEAEAD